MGVFFALGAVVVWSSFHAVHYCVSDAIEMFYCINTNTCTFCSSNFADGVCGLKTTLKAMAAATAKTTEVKYPNTF